MICEDLPKVERGQVWYVDTPDVLGVGGVPSGRPVVIVSSNAGCMSSSRVTVVPMTGSPQRIRVNPRIWSMQRESWARCGDVSTISVDTLRDYKMTLSPEDMHAIDAGIMLALGLAQDNIKTEDPPDAVGLTVERDMYKRLYERALEKLVESAYARESRPVDVASQPEQPKKKTVRVIADPVEPEPEEPVKANKNRSWVRREPIVGAEKVNINTCVAQDLIAIGMERSAAYSITGHRNKNGAFSDVLDLLKVKRISAAMLEKFESLLEV